MHNHGKSVRQQVVVVVDNSCILRAARSGVGEICTEAQPGLGVGRL